MFYASGTVDLVCPEGKDVTVDAATCQLHIPAQKGLGTLTYANNGSNVNIAVNVTKITSTHTDGFLCPFGSSGHNAEGVLETPAGEPLLAKAASGSLSWEDSAAPQFTASNGAGTTITAADTGNGKFTVTGQEFTCEEATYSGQAPATSFTSLTISATYNRCKTNSGEATVTGFGAGGCDFVFYASGTVGLVCPEGKDVTFDLLTCQVHIPAQKGIGTLSYADGAGDISIAFNLTKITSTHTDGFLCPFGSSGHNGEGVLETPATEPLTATANAGTIAWDS